MKTAKILCWLAKLQRGSKRIKNDVGIQTTVLASNKAPNESSAPGIKFLFMVD